jgi:hypothetical protein
MPAHPARRTTADPAFWDAPLSRVLTVRDTSLRTLREAGLYLTDRYGNIVHSYALEHSIQLLMRAAERGERKDIRAATDQVWRFLQGQRA